MAGNGNAYGKGTGKGLDNAADNFANGYFEHNTNGAAGNGLDNAASNNAASQSTVIDFDSGVDVVTGDDGHGGILGTYSQDGFTMEWRANQTDSVLNDVDMDGDLEFGSVNRIGSVSGKITADSGENFAVESFDIVGDDGSSNGFINIIAVNEEDGSLLKVANADDGRDLWTGYYRDGATGDVDSVELTSAEAIAFLDDVSSVQLVGRSNDGPMGLDNFTII